MNIKRNKCIEHDCEDYVWSNKRCKRHDMVVNPSKYSLKKDNGLNKPIQKTYVRRKTNELALFLKIYAERKGKCQITGEQIPFNVSSFAHILGKGAYPSLRLDENNILMVKTEIHDLYDNQGREKLLTKYPKAILIYELKDKLREKYYNERSPN